MILSNEDIISLINQYDRESKALKEEALRICWHMRGGVTYDEAFTLSSQDRKIIDKIITDNLETTKKTGLPYF